MENYRLLKSLVNGIESIWMLCLGHRQQREKKIQSAFFIEKNFTVLLVCLFKQLRAFTEEAMMPCLSTF